MAQQTQVLQAAGQPVEFVQPGFPGGEQFFALLFQQADAPVHGGHEQVRGAAGLEDARLPDDLGQGQPRPRGVEDGGLGQAGEHLVQAGHGQVCPLAHGAGGKGGVEAQMGPVGLVDQDGDALFMGDGADPGGVAEDAVVGGAGVDDELHVRVLCQGLGHLLRGDGPSQAEGRLGGGGQKDRVQAAKLHGVVNGLVAVAGD